jgi:hypothetical protein
LAGAFDERARACKDGVANMGSVIVAAVADERAGVENVVSSVTAWVCDPERFDAAWITAVNETLAAARATRN